MTECNCHLETGECQGPVGCKAIAEIERLRAALEPFAQCSEIDEAEVDHLVGKRGAISAARAAYQQTRGEE